MLLFSKPLDTGFGFFIQSWLHLCAYLFIYLFANLHRLTFSHELIKPQPVHVYTTNIEILNIN